MKVLIGGKGGSGKSTVTALVARAMRDRGYRVLVVDADESNMGLHRMLGADGPAHLLECLGGRPAVREKLSAGLGRGGDDETFFQGMTMDDLPEGCRTEIDGIGLMPVGKIDHFGEGCACMIGTLSKALLSRLATGPKDLVLMDAEAGLEHFGRRVDASCDLILGVVDPTHESLLMAEKMHHLARGAGVPLRLVVNKVAPATAGIMESRLDTNRIVARLAQDEALFMAALEGRPVPAAPAGLDALCGFLETFRKPVRMPLMPMA